MEGLNTAGVSFVAGGRTILDDVSLNVRRGETLAVIGPSGSGKTTLLRIIAGLERPTSGSVWFGGREVTGLAAHRRGFGMMFQDHALFPHLDVAGNIEFGLRQAHSSAARRIARRDEVLNLVGLRGFGTRTIERLSGGERQRVALARSLAPEPGLLLLDEPLGSLDRGLRERLSGELRTILGNLDVTVIYVTHDQVEAFAVAGTIAVLNEGTVARVATPRELWTNPQTEFVARFLGMENIIPGIRDGEGTVVCAFGTFRPTGDRPGPVTLLIRGERAEIVPAPRPGIVTGRVQSSVFRGPTSLVEVSAGPVRGSFELPSDSGFPTIGEMIHLKIAGVQVVGEG